MHRQLKFNIRFAIHLFLLCLVTLGVVEAKQDKQEVALFKEWQQIGTRALDSNLPIVLLVEISGCRFCKIVKQEFLNPLALSERYKDKVIFSRISLDPGQLIINIDGQISDTRDFCVNYDAMFTPTIVFLDGAGKQLTKNLIGMSGRDYFGYYLEKRIEESMKALDLTEQLKIDNS